MKQQRHRGRLVVEFDSTQINHDDPGAGTPVMVYLGKFPGYVQDIVDEPFACATYWCAVGEAAIEDYELTHAEREWLDELAYAVEEFLDRYPAEKVNVLLNLIEGNT